MNKTQGPFLNGQENMRMTDEQARLQAEGMQQWALWLDAYGVA